MPKEKTNERTSYLAKNTVLFAICSFGSKIISFFLVPLYTNVLSTSDYGTADLITTSASLLLFIFTLNITSSVLRFGIEDKENQNAILCFGLKVFSIGSVTLLLCITIFSQLGWIDWGVEEYCFLFLIFVMTGINEMLNNYLRAVDKVKYIVFMSLATTLTIVTCNVVFLVYYNLGLRGYLLSSVLGNLLGCVIGLIVIKPKFGKESYLSAPIKKEMIYFSIPLIFNGIAWWMNASIDKYFIVAMLGTDQNGIYAVASKIPAILSMCLTIFMQAWNLSVIKEYKSDDRDNFYSLSYNVINTILLIVASGLILLNIPLCKFLFAKDFFLAWQYSSVLLISGVFSGMGSFVGSFFTAAKNSKIFGISTVAAAVVNLGLNYYLIPILGLQGAAIATAISFLMIWLIRLAFSKKYVNLKITWWRDILSYGLIILQVILEHFSGHQYFLQALIFAFIVLLNIKSIVYLLRTIWSLSKRVTSMIVNLKLSHALI